MALRKTIFGRLKSNKKLFLDEVPNQAAYAVSLRKLSKSYSGYCIRVRRGSDNAETDIGFDGDAINIFSLLLFAGLSDLFITIWYDQSGRAQNFTQTNPGAQPQIVSSGSVILENGLPTVQFTTSTWLFQSNTDSIHEVSIYYVVSIKPGSSAYYGVARHTPATGYGFALYTSNGTQNPGYVPYLNGSYRGPLQQIFGAQDSFLPTPLTPRGWSVTEYPDSLAYKFDGIAGCSLNESGWGYYSHSGINLGYNDSKANMNLSEYIVYPNANRSAFSKQIENVNSYYN